MSCWIFSSHNLLQHNHYGHLAIWVWFEIKQEGLRRVWSMFPLTRAVHLGTFRNFAALGLFFLYLSTGDGPSFASPVEALDPKAPSAAVGCGRVAGGRKLQESEAPAKVRRV